MGGVVDAITGGGSRDAADAQVAAAGMSMREMRRALTQSLEFQEKALAQSQEMFETALDLGEPYRDTGQEALARYESLLYGIPMEETAAYQAGGITPSGDVTQPYDFRTSPGYEFRVSEGQKAIERGAAAKSGLLSGATLKATERYGQDMASLEYDKILNRIGGLIDTGVRAAGAAGSQALQSGAQQAGILGQSGQLAFGTGQGLAGALSQVGAARASGYLGTQQAGTNILNMAAGWAGTRFGQPEQQQPQETIQWR